LPPWAFGTEDIRFVGTEKPARTDLYKLVDRYFVRVNSSTFVKAGWLEQIARRLNIDLHAKCVRATEALLD
jgi:hypothetical protein